MLRLLNRGPHFGVWLPVTDEVATYFSLAGRIQVLRSFSGPLRINSRGELIPGSSDLVGRS